MKTSTLLFAVSLAALSFARAGEAPVVGAPAPDFALTDSSGVKRSLSEFKGKYVVLEWTNPGCPFVKKHYGSGNMQKLQAEYTKRGVVWLSIDSSAPAEQGFLEGDSAKQARQTLYAASTALLLDPDGKVGHLYHATNTPDMYVIDPEGKLIYEGAIDSIASADPADIDKATNYVQVNLDDALSGKPVSHPVTKAYGCSVKYQEDTAGAKM
jgi:peroxiredoxin